MNKKDKEMEYQKGITELYEKTQEMGRGDFVKMIYDLQQEKEKIIKLIEKLKQFYIEDVKDINFIPLSNFTKNINILLSKLKESDKDVSKGNV